MNETEVVHATDMDSELKLLAVQNWTLAIQYSIKGEYELCFQAYKSLYHLIEPYEFTSKDTLRELTTTLTEFVHEFKRTNTNSKIPRNTMIKLQKNQFTFEQILGIYMSELPKAYHSLNLWFKSITNNIDSDITISDQNFNSRFTGVEKKKKELLTALNKEQVFEFLTPTMIHDMYAKWRYDNAI